MDYYNTLQVNKNVTPEDLNTAFHRLAMRCHSDSNHSPAKRTQSTAKFNQISEAYGVLSDPIKRRIYDLYGQEGLISDKFRFGSPPSSLNASRYYIQYPESQIPNYSYRFKPRSCEDSFVDALKAERGAFGVGPSSNCGGYFGKCIDDHIANQRGRRKADSVEEPFPCSLQDLYRGVSKEVTISMDVFDILYKVETITETLTVEIKPGCKKGTKITFPEKGKQQRGIKPGDRIFVVEEKLHPVYKREGNDLVVDRKLTLLEALAGTAINPTTLDERSLMIGLEHIVMPGAELVVPDEGMPNSVNPAKKGDLRIRFDVIYPLALTKEQKTELRRVLGSVSGCFVALVDG